MPTNEELFDQMPESRDELILQNMPLVTHIARKVVRRRAIDFEDLVSEGVIALMKCVDRFDPSRGIKFVTYAWRGIYNHMTKYANRNGSVVTMPNLESYTSADIEAAASVFSCVQSISEPGFDVDSGSLPVVDEVLEREHQYKAMDLAERACRILADRELSVLRRHAHGLTIGEIANADGRSWCSVRRTYNRALQKLRQPYYQQVLI